MIERLSLSLRRLQELGVRTLIMSGDRRDSVRSVAQRIGIAEADVFAELRPEDKQRLVGALRAEKAVVAMVRDCSFFPFFNEGRRSTLQLPCVMFDPKPA